MCLGKAMPRTLDTHAAATELQATEQELSTSAQVCILPNVSSCRHCCCTQSCSILREPWCIGRMTLSSVCSACVEATSVPDEACHPNMLCCSISSQCARLNVSGISL